MSRRISVVFFVLALAVSSTAWLSGQAGSNFQDLVAATNAAGDPVADLKPEDVLMSEKAGKATVTKIEPFALPVKVAIAVDNGSDSSLALPNYRNGLKGFVEAFPADTEMTIITTSPQPPISCSGGWPRSPPTAPFAAPLPPSCALSGVSKRRFRSPQRQFAPTRSTPVQ